MRWAPAAHHPPPRLPAVNLAVALAQHLNLRVGLLDADVYGPSVPRMMSLAGKPRVDEGEGREVQGHAGGAQARARGGAQHPS